MNGLFVLSVIITFMAIFSAFYSLDRFKKGYGSSIPPYFEAPFISPKKATKYHRLTLLISVIVLFIASIFGVIVAIKTL